MKNYNMQLLSVNAEIEELEQIRFDLIDSDYNYILRLIEDRLESLYLRQSILMVLKEIDHEKN